MSAFEEIKAANLCIGCGYCASFPDVSMELDASGFLVPEGGDAALKAGAENLVKKSCPGLNAENVACLHDNTPGARVDYMWGTYFTAVTGHSTDDHIRYLGSSGGVITAIADWLVRSGHVNGVLVTHYDDHYPIGTRSTMTDDAAQIRESGGSKYCPAAPLAALGDIRSKEGSYAVVGRPCDIATLRRAIDAGDPVGAKIKYLLSFFCAGTPSDNGNRALLSGLGVDDVDTLVRLRHRGEGWPGHTVAQLNDGSQKACTYNESWGGVLRRHTHSLCKICSDGIGEQADIVAADAWYGDEGGYPQFQEADGRSLVLARTEIGKELLDAAVSDGVLHIDAFDVREIDRMQPGQIERRRQLSIRVAAYRLMGLKTPHYRDKALRQYAQGQKLHRKALIFAVTIRKLLRSKFRKIRRCITGRQIFY